MDQQPEAYKRKGPAPKPLVLRILSHKKIMPNGCIEWTGCLNNKGYGMINVGRNPTLVHRVSYELFVGRLDSRLVLDHLCKNRKCFNPAHIEQVSSQENMLRGTSVCSVNAKKTHCKRGHEFSKENTLTIENGRQCKICEKSRKHIRQMAEV